jgi:hypothetical protein
MKTEVYYDGTLEGLFALLDRFQRGSPADWPRRVRRRAGPAGPEPALGRGDGQGLLFDGGAAAESASLPSPPALLPDPVSLGGAAAVLFQVSADAYDALIYAWMAPLDAQALRYALTVLAAAKEAAAAADAGNGRRNPAALAGMAAVSPGPPPPVPWYSRAGAREGAGRAARNRGDEDCRAVLAAVYKVAHEIDRLMGFLRFKPDAGGRYIARCAPDHLVLPALAPHFTLRFGNTPWALIDERRGLVLLREGGSAPRIMAAGFRNPGPGDSASLGQDSRGFDPWEEIWRSYHRVINIESRKNLRLQGQFVPLRYREYLSEFGSG